MKLEKFDKLPGKTPLEKLTLWSKGETIYTQQKFNGINARYFPASGRLVTRDNKLWDMGRFPAQFLYDLDKVAGEDILYGELLYHGKPLQEIAGLLSVNGLNGIPEEELGFIVYDCRIVGLSMDEQPYRFRRDYIIDSVSTQTVMICDTNDHTPEQACSFYDRMLAEDREGCVYRVDPCYDAGPEDSPNPHAVKRKALHEAEGICCGFTEGTGKRKGMVGCLILELPNGKHLSVGGGKGLSDARLWELFNNPPYGLPVTYSYEELSTNGTPLRPQFKAVRNYE